MRLDPLGTEPPGAQELTPEFHGLTERDLDLIPGSALGFPDATAADVVKRLRAIYSSTIGFDLEHIEEEAERDWFRKVLEGGDARADAHADEKKAVLARLTEVDGLERFLGRAYVGKKRFSIEGTDALVPMLDAAIERAALSGRATRRHRHGAPRPPQRARAHPRQAVRDDLRGVRGSAPRSRTPSRRAT